MRAVVAALAAAFSALSVLPATAADTPVDLELVLAVDASRSIDRVEAATQRLGYVNAFRHPSLLSAIASGALGRIAVAYVEWGDAGTQYLVVPWTLVEDKASAEGFATALEREPVRQLRGTSISGGLAFSYSLFKENGYGGERRAIDISGDGTNRFGPPVNLIRDAIMARGVVINGLPIIIAGGSGTDTLDLERYYRDCVIGGPGAFTVRVERAADFDAAIRRKLIMEVAGKRGPPAPVVLIAARPKTDCGG